MLSVDERKVFSFNKFKKWCVSMENVTLRDTFSYMHSMLSIDFIDAITSKIEVLF